MKLKLWVTFCLILIASHSYAKEDNRVQFGIEGYISPVHADDTIFSSGLSLSFSKLINITDDMGFRLGLRGRYLVTDAPANIQTGNYKSFVLAIPLSIHIDIFTLIFTDKSNKIYSEE